MNLPLVNSSNAKSQKMSTFFTEASYENSLIELFSGMGYRHVYGPDVERDYYSPLYEAELRESLCRLNRSLPGEAIEEAIRRVRDLGLGDSVQKNAVFTEYLQHGVEVTYTERGENRSAPVYLVDYTHADNNSFIIANQWTYVEYSNKRPDLLVFLNGIPVVLME